MSEDADRDREVGALLARHAKALGDPGAPVLDRLRAHAEFKRLGGALERELVARARREGATWEGIAEALGLARQTVHRRFGRPGGSAG
jgi:hypothetical protein